MLTLSSVSRGISSDVRCASSAAHRGNLIGEQRGIRPQLTARERERDRGNAERDALHRGGDGARVEHVLAHVLAVIDSAQHEVRPLGHQRLDREHHAVRRRAVHLPAACRRDVTGRIGMVQRERVARRALLAVGRDHGDLAERLGGLHQTLESVREDAVVVRAEETHQATGRDAMAPDRAHDAHRVVPRAEVARRTVHRRHVDARDAIAGARSADEKLGLVLVAIAGRMHRLRAPRGASRG